MFQHTVIVMLTHAYS